MTLAAALILLLATRGGIRHFYSAFRRGEAEQGIRQSLYRDDVEAVRHGHGYLLRILCADAALVKLSGHVAADDEVSILIDPECDLGRLAESRGHGIRPRGVHRAPFPFCHALER